MESIRIRLATHADQNRWDEYVLQHPEGTAYQFFAWREVVKKAYGFGSCYLLAEKGSAVCGILPLIDFRIPFLGRSLISLPYCDAGGLLADGLDIEQRLLKEALLSAGRKSVKVKIRAVKPLRISSANGTEKVRMVLDLPENSEQFLASLKSKLRTKIKKPAKSGYTVRFGTHELVKDFYSIFAENMHELGSPVHSRKWFEAIISEYKEKVRIAVVFTPEGIPAASGIILLHPKTVANPWASSLRKYNYMKPNMLLYSTLLSFASDNGFEKFDFGRSTPNEGTYLFKEQWGAQPHQLYWYELGAEGNFSTSLKHAENVPKKTWGNRQLAAAIWRKLPAMGANQLGPRIRKYISL